MKEGWYIVRAYAPDHVTAQFLLFYYDRALVDTVQALRRTIAGVEETLGGWGSICLNGVVSMLALNSIPDLPEFAGIDEDELYASEVAQFVTGTQTLDEALYAQPDLLFRSECHAVRVFKESVYLRALCKYNSGEVESACIEQMFGDGANATTAEVGCCTRS